MTYTLAETARPGAVSSFASWHSKPLKSARQPSTSMGGSSTLVAPLANCSSVRPITPCAKAPARSVRRLWMHAIEPSAACSSHESAALKESHPADATGLRCSATPSSPSPSPPFSAVSYSTSSIGKSRKPGNRPAGGSLMTDATGLCCSAVKTSPPSTVSGEAAAVRQLHEQRTKDVLV